MKKQNSSIKILSQSLPVPEVTQCSAYTLHQNGMYTKLQDRGQPWTKYNVVIIIIIFLHGLGRLTCSGIDTLPPFSGASTISSFLRLVVEGVFQESSVFILSRREARLRETNWPPSIGVFVDGLVNPPKENKVLISKDE
jgi:hypothetical protein